jgi:hypothetical protein
MNTEFVKFKSEVPYSKTIINTNVGGAVPFDWDGTLKIEPDPFFDSTRWIGTLGGEDLHVAHNVPSTQDGHRDRFNSLPNAATTR